MQLKLRIITEKSKLMESIHRNNENLWKEEACLQGTGMHL